MIVILLCWDLNGGLKGCWVLVQGFIQFRETFLGRRIKRIGQDAFELCLLELFVHPVTKGLANTKIWAEIIFFQSNVGGNWNRIQAKNQLLFKSKADGFESRDFESHWKLASESSFADFGRQNISGSGRARAFKILLQARRASEISIKA